MKKIYIIGCAGEYANARFCVEHEIIIGRNPQKCQIVFSSKCKGISGVHCKVYVSEGNVFLADQNSTNGTFLQNGERVRPGAAVQLQEGGQFYLGNKQNVFRVEAAPDVEPIQQPEQPPASVPRPHIAGRTGFRPGVLAAAAAGAAVIVICIIASIASSQKARQAKEEAFRAQIEADKVQNEVEFERYKAEQAQKELEEEQNKGAIDKTIDAVEGWLEYLP